ncbi:MAG: amidohydrolase [Dehalococcoidia bacterium]|nr:amidohydrolase [Dehalococcoidia bacterium]
MRRYKLISADGHVNEPPDIWTHRMPKKFQDRAPRMERMAEGHAWVFEGYGGPINFGLNACAGLPVEQAKPWIFWEEVPARSYQGKARAEALEQGGIDAELLYATPRIAVGMLAAVKDPEFHIATVRGYNDWLSDLCSQAPGRLFGLALMPAVGVDAAVAELQRAMRLPGMKSPYIGRWPNGGPTLTAEDDRFWAAASELGVPVSVHVTLIENTSGDSDPNRTRLGSRGEFRGLGGGTSANCLEMIYGGVFDRYPNLRIVFAECESGWVACAKQTFDDRFARHAKIRAMVREKPSHYFDRNIFTTFVLDRFAIVNRQYVGLSQMMWSNDLFHIVCEWPNDLKAIERDFAGVPEGEKQQLLAGNAARVYKLGDGF